VAGFISFSTRSPRLSVVAKPGDGVPVVTDGYGTIETITRPLRRGLTRWTGSNPLTLTIPILLDGYRTGRSIEPQIADLEQMAAVDGGEPMHVTIDCTGNIVPHHDDHKWLVTGLDFGEAISSHRGRRLRQAITVQVTAVVEATTEKSVAKRNKGSGNHARRYRVKAGDTLRSIARKVLGDPDRWVDIRRANNITDPRIVGKPGKKIGCVGTVLKIPK
jgi:hypothetical protein